MGYTLRIGQLKTVWNTDEGLESSILLTAELHALQEAPAFGEPTDNTNSRWPSYSAWADFARFVNLYDFFNNKSTGVLRNHPGCVPLTKEHKTIVDNAFEKFKQKFPKATPGFSSDDDQDWPLENEHMARLVWLKFWIDWSLENCTEPVFYNS